MINRGWKLKDTNIINFSSEMDNGLCHKCSKSINNLIFLKPLYCKCGTKYCLDCFKKIMKFPKIKNIYCRKCKKSYFFRLEYCTNEEIFFF